MRETAGTSRPPLDRHPPPTYGQSFWRTESRKFSEPWYRLEKTTRLIGTLTHGRKCELLDVGCGPATLMRMLPPNIEYHGIDIAIHDPAPNLLEADLLEAPIAFGEMQFDIVVAQGLFEYLGGAQAQKFVEISQVLRPSGFFIVTYTNFGHRRRYVSEAFSNVQPFEQFRASLSQYFTIDRIIPESHNWKHAQPNRPWLKLLNLHVNRRVPLISRKLAVEYYFVCSPPKASRTQGKSWVSVAPLQ